MAFTLVDALKTEGNTLRAGIIEGLLRRSTVMEDIPWEDINALATTVTRWKTLPSVGFRKINAAYAESAGTFEQLQESTYPLGGDIDVDKVFVRDGNAVIDQRATQIRMKLRSIAYTFQDYFINGDQSSDPDGITGIKKRVANLGAAQTITAATNGLDVQASSTNQQTFLDLLDQLFYTFDDGAPDALYMNQKSLLNIQSVLRRLGLFDQTRDMFGRMVTVYKGAKLYDMGVKSDQTTSIILNTETTGASSVTTSIYAVKFGVGEFMHGIQQYDLDVKDLGELQSAPQFRTRVDWPIGLAIWQDRSVARLLGLIWP
jgi:major capsid protein gp7